MSDKKQIAVRISDGLGNQMFQYAFAYVLSKETQHQILLDPFFWKRGLRQYQINKYSLSLNRRWISPIKEYILGLGPVRIPHLRKKYREKLCVKKWKLVEDNAVRSIEDIEAIECDYIYARGYWQRAALFDAYYEKLCKEFSPQFSLGEKAEVYRQQMRRENSVSLHIRRTDYVRGVNSVCLDWDFYKLALQRLKEGIGDFTLYLFTDDKEYAREKFRLHDFVLVEDCADYEEMELMHACKHHIVANSSFSFWGAYLGENRGGIVIAPIVGDWKRDYYPDCWQCIEASFREE